jgi:Fe-Mn family superoxide dismutase
MQKRVQQNLFKGCAISLTLIAILFFINACDLSEHKPLIAQKKLAYDESALEPTISTRTMQLHYGRHYSGYFEKANRLVKDSRFKGWTMIQIIQQIPKDNEFSVIFNNVAQAWNHEFFFEGIKPQGGGIPKGELLDKIKTQFGTFEAFKAEFFEAAQTRFGSGWVWLVLADGQLKIVTTANADTPLAHGMHPLFTVDLWEHAYYLDYENRRNEYVEAVVANLADWDFIAARLETSLPSGK